MATAATAPEMEHCALLALVREGPDEAAAAAVTAFAGDINARSPKGNTVLEFAITFWRSLTVAALAARGDCNPNVVTRFGTPVLSLVAGPCYQTDMAAFLAHFPSVHIHACNPAGETPLHCAAHWDWGSYTNAQLLLAAGADPTIRSLSGLTPAQVAHDYGRTHLAKLLEAAEAWHDSLRRGWLRAVVGMSGNIVV